MKKNFGGFVLIAVIAFVAVLFTSVVGASIAVNASGGKPTFIANKDKRINGDLRFDATNQSGIYIVRDEYVVADAEPVNVYWGELTASESVPHAFFHFTPVKDVNGQWVEGTGAPWFYTYSNPINPIDCTWEFPIKSPAGKYGIRARALYQFVNKETGNSEYREIYFDGEYSDFYFTILYAEDLVNIKMLDENGSNIHKVNPKEQDTTITIGVSSNSGAIRLDYLNEEDGFWGYLGAHLNFIWSGDEEVTVKITLNGQVVDSIPYELVDDKVIIELPNNLPKGQYLVTVRHAYNGAIGVYVIDNGDTAYLLFGTISLTGIAIAFEIIGVIGLFSGLFLVYGHKFAFAVKKAEYKKIDDKVYENDAKSVRKREKEERERQAKIAKGELKKEHKSGPDFFAKINESRHLQDEAAKAGLTVEQYKKAEAERGATADLQKYAMRDVRAQMGATEMVENPNASIDPSAPARRPSSMRNELPESHVLDSVQKQNLYGADQFNTAGEKTQEQLAPIAPRAGGILGRINKALDETEDPTNPNSPPRP